MTTTVTAWPDQSSIATVVGETDTAEAQITYPPQFDQTYEGLQVKFNCDTGLAYISPWTTQDMERRSICLDLYDWDGHAADGVLGRGSRGVANIAVLVQLRALVQQDVVKVRIVQAQLDVNANGSIDDAVDGVTNYMPGYEGTTPKLSTGAFNVATFSPQHMKIVVDGLGTSTNLDYVFFELTLNTQYSGYASNRSDPSVEWPWRRGDYSFKDTINIDWTFVSNGSSPPPGAQMEGNKTYVDFWAKDYGGYCRVQVTTKFNNGESGRPRFRSLIL